MFHQLLTLYTPNKSCTAYFLMVNKNNLIFLGEELYVMISQLAKLRKKH